MTLTSRMSDRPGHRAKRPDGPIERVTDVVWTSIFFVLGAMLDAVEAVALQHEKKKERRNAR